MSTLKSYLATIADAIRQKKGTTEPINAGNFASEILSIQGGGSLNVAYSLTPPTDTSKIWLQCAEPQGVEVQNYLGECAVSNVANWGAIDNPVDGYSSFYCGYYNIGYIGNNQIAIVGYNHIRIYDLTSKSYIADYTISVGTGNIYTNVLFKDSVLYFGYENYLYRYDLTTQTITNSTFSYPIKYIFFSKDNEIDAFTYYSNGICYRYRYNINSNSRVTVASVSGNYFDKIFTSNSFPIVKIGNYVYNLNYNYGVWKYDLLNDTITTITTMADFVTNTIGGSSYTGYYAIGDNERYIYLVGGSTNKKTKYNQICRYDTINDSFELLEKKLLDGKYRHFVMLIDNRVYIFGGANDTSTSSKYGRVNQIDYFDLQYTLPQNNAILTINNKTDKYLPLINTEKLKINSNISSAYLGNADNLAEKVNAYHHNGYGWVGINCEDYDTYFIWSTITNETINSALVIDLSTYYTTNAKDVALSVSSTNATGFGTSITGTELTVTPLEVSQTTTITVTATVNAVEYQTTFTVTSADIIASA